ncbi:MAG: hypothetical protein KGJ78_14855 [Alphaproteobacteria bacterium]|nr:hypothetical protein [Alphaproteobacteria bacterium]
MDQVSKRSFVVRVRHYRGMAGRALCAAQQATTPEAKAELTSLAERWLSLAVLAESAPPDEGGAADDDRDAVEEDRPSPEA